jgi:arylsulfatase A-like enzyme
METLGLGRDNTEVVIYGDHPMIGAWNGIFDPSLARSVPIIFASRPAQRMEKQVAFYDVLPTVLDALGVVYSPRWPFGRVVPKESTLMIPGDDEFATIGELFN